METFLIRALQLIMSLSLLVIVHEGGHFIFARLFKTRVEKFCLFFDPWFTLFKFKPKHSDTEYGIGWLPLGGYVKIAGMIDESMDTEQMKQPMQPWEFRAKPAWQRLLIMVGGVLFNFLLALFIYSMILFTWGDEYIPVQKAPLGMDFNETAKAIGFRDGDILISADGVPFERYDGDLLTSIVDARQVSVLRDGEAASVYIPEDMMNRLLADSVRFASFRFPYVVDSLIVGSPAASAGLQVGDSITHLDGKSIAYYDFKEEMLKRKKANASHEVTLTYVRNGVTDTLSMMTNADYEIGVAARTATDKLLPVVRKEYSFLSCRRIFGGKDSERLRRPDEISLLQGRSQATRRFRNHRQYFPRHVGLAPVLVHDGIPLHHPCLYEYSAHPRTGRRTRVIPHLRNHCTPQAQRQVYGTCTDGGHVPLVRFADLGKLQRYTEVFLLKNKT